MGIIPYCRTRVHGEEKKERKGSGVPHDILRVERKFSSCPSKQNRIGSETGHILCSPSRQVLLDNLCSLLILNQRIRKDVRLPERLCSPRKEADR